jgi:sister chromatid cohesion protein PDS5
VIENNFHEITLSNTQLIVFQEIFRIFISIFADLAETSSPYLTRRMKILENVAALKCSIIMFDIDCEDLALDMVKIFFSSMK